VPANQQSNKKSLVNLMAYQKRLNILESIAF